jgi:hypothetical protein
MNREQLDAYYALPSGFIVTVKYIGPTGKRNSRWKATYRRDSDCIFTHTCQYDHPEGHYLAAIEVLKKVDVDRQKVLPGCPPCRIVARSYLDGSPAYLAETC